MSQPMGDTMATSLKGFLVSGSAWVGGVFHDGIIARANDLLPLPACHPASWSFTDAEGAWWTMGPASAGCDVGPVAGVSNVSFGGSWTADMAPGCDCGVGAVGWW